MSSTRQLNPVIKNRQRVRSINTRQLRQITAAALAELGVTDCELCFHLVGAKEMARVNMQFLQHKGSTDVITFDYSEPETRNSKPGTELSGELFICLDDAVKQAREFKTTWQSELVRYVIHGLLHLLGYDDLKPVARRKMKREENSLVRRMEKQFAFARLHKAPANQRKARE